MQYSLSQLNRTASPNARMKPAPVSRRVLLFAALMAASLIFNFVWIRTSHGPDSSLERNLLLQVFVLWPLLFFWLVYPVTRKARQLLLPLMLGMLFGSLVLPAASKQWWIHIDALRWLVLAVLVVGELWVIVLLLRSLTTLRGSEAPEDLIREVVSRQFGAGIGGRLVSTELMMWFYALFSWKAERYAFAGDEFFSVHRHQGNAENQKGFLMLIGAEIPLAHGLLWFWSPTGALVVTALSIYGFIWLLGEYRATLLRPVSIDAEFLYLRYGLLGNERIPLAAVAGAMPWNTPVPRQRGVLRHKGAGIPNVRIDLREPTWVETTLGQREISQVFIAVDQPSRLINSLEATIARCHAERPE